VVHTRLRAPASRIGPADDVDGTAKASPLFAKYGTRVEAESASEKLLARLADAEEVAEQADEPAPARKPRAGRRRRPTEPPAPAPSGGLDQLGDFLGSREGKALQRKVTRGLFGMLKKRF
jgi:DNA double-strand break repair helicase HerA and related ATPase